MKPRIVLIGSFIAALFTHALFGQASFELSNRNLGSSVNAPVTDSLGVPLRGTNYCAELWGGATSNSLTPLVLVDQGDVRLITSFRTDLPGYFFSGVSSLSVISVVPHSFAWLQVHAWEARLGGTYEAVSALGIGGYGASPLFYAQGNNPFSVNPEIPAPLLGLQSFSLLPVVPEPGTGVLVLLGFGCLAARRWFNRRDHSP